MKFDISKIEIAILFFLAIWFQFNATNVNPTLGHIYVAFILIAAVFLMLDPKRSIHLKSRYNESTGLAIMKGAVGYIILILVGGYIIVPGINAIRAALSATTPLLATNPLINNITFGGAVPIAETIVLFAVALDLIASFTNTEIGRQSLTKLKTWGIVIGLSLVFMIFHLTSKGVSNVSTLAVVFFMAIISFILILWDESYESALWFHIIANLSALLL